jgi:kynurenine formamidase
MEWISMKRSFWFLSHKTDSIFYFTGLHQAAQWKIKLFGLDTASVDYGQSTDFKAHQIPFSKNIPALENVANIDTLPAKGATVYAAPQLITVGNGGPCRVFATLTKPCPSAGQTATSH